MNQIKVGDHTTVWARIPSSPKLFPSIFLSFSISYVFLGKTTYFPIRERCFLRWRFFASSFPIEFFWNYWSLRLISSWYKSFKFYHFRNRDNFSTVENQICYFVPIFRFSLTVKFFERKLTVTTKKNYSERFAIFDVWKISSTQNYLVLALFVTNFALLVHN